MYENLEPVTVNQSSTSYFSEPEAELDPSLFEGEHLKANVRDWVLDTVHDFLDGKYTGSGDWARVWIAGSGISYQWSADRDPGDLDVMLGINYVRFRHANPGYAGLSDMEIARMLNVDMFSDLYPQIDGVSFGRTRFEITVYANMGVTAEPTGILTINPYAAYDLTSDRWAVMPQRHPTHHIHPSWDQTVEMDRMRGEHIIGHYGKALEQITGAQNDAHRTNAVGYLKNALDAASGLYDEIHAGRKAAFNEFGHGYADFHNYRWQSGKRTGVIQAMKRLKDYQSAAQSATEMETYGMELPDHETLIRRAGTYYGNY